ncbi:MAG: hypothetical protein WBI17_12530 [Clostridiaceae bacterium]
MMNEYIVWAKKSISKAIPLLIVVMISALLISCFPQSNEPSNLEATEELRTAVTMPLSLYAPIMSSVPGFPIEVEFPSSWVASGYDVIVTCKNGMLISWNSPDYRVNEQGISYKLSSSSTIYWSPYRMQKMPSDDTLTFTLYKGNKQIGQITVEIKANDQGFYNGMMK